MSGEQYKRRMAVKAVDVTSGAFPCACRIAYPDHKTALSTPTQVFFLRVHIDEMQYEAPKFSHSLTILTRNILVSSPVRNNPNAPQFSFPAHIQLFPNKHNLKHQWPRPKIPN